MSRHTVKTKMVCEVVGSGVLGEIHYIHAVNGFEINDPGNVRLRRETGGGALFDMGCYCVNFVDLIMEVAGATLTAANAHFITRGDVDVRCSANLAYSNGTFCSIATWFDSQPMASAEIVGKKGVLTIPFPFTDEELPMTLRHYDFAADPACRGKEIMVIDPDYIRLEEIRPGLSDRYRLEVEEMSRAILEKRQPSFRVESSLRNMELIERLYGSADKWPENGR